MSNDKDWMDELKSGKSVKENIEGLVSGQTANIAQGVTAKDPGKFHGIFKFCLGEKVYSRIHECKGIVEYSEMTRFISGDQISYKVRFNDAEDIKTEISNIDEQWLDKI